MGHLLVVVQQTLVAARLPPPSVVQICRAISSVSCRHAISYSALSSWYALAPSEIVDGDLLFCSCALLLAGVLVVKILSRVVGLRLPAHRRRRVIEVVEHQVHVFLLFALQVVVDLHVSVHLDFDVGVRLAGKRARLREVARPLRLLSLLAVRRHLRPGR